MTLKEKLKKISSMMNRCWHYQGEDYKFLSYEVEEDYVIISLDEEGKDLTIPAYDVLEFIHSCKEINTETGIVKKKNFVPNSIANENIMQGLKDTLLDNISKVKENPDYVPQAKVVSNTVQALINLAKLELEYRKNV